MNLLWFKKSEKPPLWYEEPLPPDRCLYVREFDTHTLLLVYRPTWQPLYNGEKEVRWFRSVRLISNGRGDLTVNPNSRNSSWKMGGAACYEPHEMLDYDIRDANDHAQWLLGAWGVA